MFSDTDRVNLTVEVENDGDPFSDYIPEEAYINQETTTESTIKSNKPVLEKSNVYMDDTQTRQCKQ